MSGPARSERLTVSREAPHGIGVESISRRIGALVGVCTARVRITEAINGPAARSRLP